MLLKESEKTGGETKYLNRRDADYLPVAIRESKYRKEFTSALSDCVEMGNYSRGKNNLFRNPYLQ